MKRLTFIFVLRMGSSFNPIFFEAHQLQAQIDLAEEDEE